MTESGPAPSPENSDDGLRNTSQTSKPTKWSRGEIISLCTLILVFLSFLFGPGILKGYAPPVVDGSPGTGNDVAHFEGFISIVNVVLACAVLIYIRWKRTEFLQAEQPISSLAEDALAQFLRGWSLAWATWAMLYCWLAIVWLWPLYGRDRIWPWIVADFLNMLNGCFMFFLFLVLDLPSVKSPTKQHRDSQFRKNVKMVFGAGCLLFIVATITIVLRQRQPLIRSPDFLLKNLVAAFTAVGMAFFFGRLDSHYLNAPRLVLAPLYLYVILQLSWNDVAGSEAPANDPTRTIILGLACLFKFLLFWVVRSWLADGSVVRYLEAAEKYNGYDVLDQPKYEQKKSREHQVTAESKRRYIVALLFACVFIASITILLGGVSGVSQSTSDTVAWIAVFTAVVSAIGTISTTILAWRKDRREVREGELKIAQLERELEAARGKPMFPASEEKSK